MVSLHVQLLLASVIRQMHSGWAQLRLAVQRCRTLTFLDPSRRVLYATYSKVLFLSSYKRLTLNVCIDPKVVKWL